MFSTELESAIGGSYAIGIHYSLVIMVYGGTLFSEWSKDTTFPRGIHYSLGNNVWGIRYIHSDTGFQSSLRPGRLTGRV